MKRLSCVYHSVYTEKFFNIAPLPPLETRPGETTATIEAICGTRKVALVRILHGKN